VSQVESCCADPANCKRVCDVFGQAAEGARSTASMLAPTELRALERRASPRVIKLPERPAPEPPLDTRSELVRVCWCLLAGCCIAAVFLAITLFLRVVKP
jgi:hypothetical protein